MIGSKEIMIIINIVLMMLAFIALLRPGIPQLRAFDRDATTPLRFILAVFVAITHLPWLTPLKIGTPAVAVFLFISGYGMAKSYLARGDSYLDGLGLKYVIKLLGPYFVCALPWMLRMFIGGLMSDNYDYNFMFIGRQIYHGNVGVLLPNSWYPWALLYFGIVFIFSYKIRAKLNRQIAVWLGLVSYYILARYILHYGGWWYVSTWAFAIGCSYAEYENRITDIIKKLKWKYPLMLMLIYITFRFGIEKLILFKSVPLVSEISHVMLGIVIVTTQYFYPLPRWKWLMFLGTISYEYYLCHGEVYFVLSKLSITDPRLITILTLLVSIPIAYLVHLAWITIHRKIIASKI